MTNSAEAGRITALRADVSTSPAVVPVGLKIDAVSVAVSVSIWANAVVVAVAGGTARARAACLRSGPTTAIRRIPTTLALAWVWIGGAATDLVVGVGGDVILLCSAGTGRVRPMCSGVGGTGTVRFGVLGHVVIGRIVFGADEAASEAALGAKGFAPVAVLPRIVCIYGRTGTFDPAVAVVGIEKSIPDWFYRPPSRNRSTCRVVDLTSSTTAQNYRQCQDRPPESNSHRTLSL